MHLDAVTTMVDVGTVCKEARDGGSEYSDARSAPRYRAR
jgi:hypothetical protein